MAIVNACPPSLGNGVNFSGSTPRFPVPRDIILQCVLDNGSADRCPFIAVCNVGRIRTSISAGAHHFSVGTGFHDENVVVAAALLVLGAVGDEEDADGVAVAGRGIEAVGAEEGIVGDDVGLFSKPWAFLTESGCSEL